jgi:hypothetical protein
MEDDNFASTFPRADIDLDGSLPPSPQIYMHNYTTLTRTPKMSVDIQPSFQFGQQVPPSIQEEETK